MRRMTPPAALLALSLLLGTTGCMVDPMISLGAFEVFSAVSDAAESGTEQNPSD